MALQAEALGWSSSSSSSILWKPFSSQVAMPGSELTVGDGLSLPGVLGWVPRTGKFSFSQTSTTDLRVCPGAPAVTALRTFTSGSCIPFAGRIAVSLLLAQGAWLFPLLNSSHSLRYIPGSSAVLCKILCSWRLQRVRKMLGSTENNSSPRSMAWRALSSRCPGRFWCRQLICWDRRCAPQGLAGLGHLTAQPFPLSLCIPHRRV